MYKILSINPGSETLKGGLFEITQSGIKQLFEFEIKNSQAKLKTILQKLQITNLKTIKYIGIRIVHGGSYFSSPTRITPAKLKKLKSIADLAPLHDKPAIKIIEDILSQSAHANIWGIFDTEFHNHLPLYASTYALPIKISQTLKIKRYGFHGIACQNILKQIKCKYKKIPARMIICHLGGGASVTAIKNGNSIDTSMGFTPAEGLMMMTRAGDLDTGVFAYLTNKLKSQPQKIMEMLNKKSGIYGMTGTENMLQVIEQAEQGNSRSKLAIDIYIYKIIKYIFAYCGVLQGLDMLVFSGGIGYGSASIRKKICTQLKSLGIQLDMKTNKNIQTSLVKLSTHHSDVAVVAVQVDEIREIAERIMSIHR